ncbi:unnamed protein product [Zymoseptoria tritici ST99CH_1E4]|nr:unnamed protein product [Zymoseptoria tritici ST99CH_1E4]
MLFSNSPKKDPKAPATTQPSSPSTEDSESTQLHRLARQRPSLLPTPTHEVLFLLSITTSQLLTEFFVCGFTILLPTVTTSLAIPSTAATWPASAFSLVVSAFLLPFGRLGDIYGGYPIYIAGITWFAVLSLIIGFSTNYTMLVVLRAFQGLGPAAYLPAGLQLLGSTYRPGPRKNFVFFIYGAMASFGFFVGVFFAGISGQYLTWRWYFWLGAIFVSIVAVVSVFSIPSDVAAHRDNGIVMDWWGSAAIVLGLILVVYAITDSSHAEDGWRTPYILVTFVLGWMLLGVAFYIEGWVAAQPLLPFSMFKVRGMLPFTIGLFFAYGPLGIYLLYATLFAMNILDVGPMQLVAWYIPTGVLGLLLSLFGGLFLHHIPTKLLMAITAFAIMIESAILACAPSDAGYWQWFFIPMICSTVAIDFIFSVANIFFSTSLPARQQGLAGSLSNVILQLGIAVLLGFSEVIASETKEQGLRRSYQNVFWFNFACGAVALVVFMFVSIPKARSELTVDEKEAMEREGLDVVGGREGEAEERNDGRYCV